MRWKLRKVMGKTIRLYLSMSEAFMPKSRWGGAGGGGAGMEGGPCGIPAMQHMQESAWKSEAQWRTLFHGFEPAVSLFDVVY